MSQDVTLLCEYALPERFDTSGLVRQGVGRMFPYHPDIYTLASDYYGPGSLLGWFLLIASFTTMMVLWPIQTTDSDNRQRRRRKPRVTTDLLALIVCAVFAATDVLVQAVSLFGLEHRAVVITCLRFPHLRQSSPNLLKDGTLLPMSAEMPPELVEYGQKMVAITGPLAVCYIFLAVATAWAVALHKNRPSSQHTYSTSAGVAWEPSVWLVRLVLGAAAYVASCLLAYHLTLDDPQMSCGLAMLEFAWLFLFTITSGTLAVAVTVTGAVLWIVGSAAVWHAGTALGATTVYGQRANVRNLLVLAVAGLGSLSAFFCMRLSTDALGNLTLLTDLGKPLVERGQLVALFVGIVTTTFSVYEVLRHKGRAWMARRARAVGAVELSELISVSHGPL
ncbi:hypothetical protein MN608_10003 [Microdochium nivale]|nr:hypothetical protein MN608_10003 [Microdochium nivale]